MKHDKWFFLRLALTNLGKNRDTYLPFILTGIATVILFYTLLTIGLNPGLQELPGAKSLRTMLMTGTVVIGVFSAIFLLYTNSFLIRRRQTELALYSILGLERRHIARILFCETLLVFLISVTVGLAGGMLLGKLLFLLLLRLTRIPTMIAFSWNYSVAGITIAIFAAIFLLILAVNLLRGRTASPIRLLSGERQGEREPKASWLITLFGILALGTAYSFAFLVKEPLAVLGVFLWAVLLVILGTYALFTSGSIYLLKMLKKRKRFYYQSQNFISISGMMYRMKQNAAGLASICILSTMVLITLSTTISLYAGQEDNSRNQYPMDTTITWGGSGDQGMSERIDRIERLAAVHHVAVKDLQSFRQMILYAFKDGNTFVNHKTMEVNAEGGSVYQVHLMLLAEFNQTLERDMILSDGEIAMHTNGLDFNYSSVVMGAVGDTYTVKTELAEYLLHPKIKETTATIYTVVVRDMAAMRAVVTSYDSERDLQDPFGGLKYNTVFNLSGNDSDILDFSTALQGSLTDGTWLESSSLRQADWYSTFGGFLFIGIFIGGIFLIATVLIIYYKQVSEGYQDRNRFEIMQKVGMDRSAVKKTIRKQILLVFFLPLAGAVVHVAFAFGILPKMLIMFGLDNTPLFLLCTGITVLIFSLVYLGVFALTAKTYGRLVGTALRKT